MSWCLALAALVMAGAPLAADDRGQLNVRVTIPERPVGAAMVARTRDSDTLCITEQRPPLRQVVSESDAGRRVVTECGTASEPIAPDATASLLIVPI